jgi:hypothetical protein
MIAKGSFISNSQWHIHTPIADGYYLRMRGSAKQKTRAVRLRQLKETYTYEEMAKRISVNPAYLSQIGNEVVGKGRKSPRALSDNYATRLEDAFGLEPGWFDTPVDGDKPQPMPPEEQAALFGALLGKATPKTRDRIREIQRAAEEGRLTEEDIEAIGLMADRLLQKSKEHGAHGGKDKNGNTRS